MTTTASTPLLDDEAALEAQQADPSTAGNDNGNDSESEHQINHSNRPPYRRLASLFLSRLTDEQGNPMSILMGLISIVLCGTLLGLFLPHDSKFPSKLYATFSSCLGFTYFFAWSISFYPQLVTNFRRKTTAGLSVEFASLNVLGFACYTAYNVSLYSSKTVQDLYHNRYGSDAPIHVEPNDVAFAVHALVISSLTLGQILYFDGLHHAQQMNPFIVALIATILSIGVVGAMLSASRAASFFSWLDYVYLLSLCKIAVTLVKYMPQVYLNWERKSTVGWSIWQILLDLTGGLLSNLQLVLDCAALGDFSGITGNVAKLMLGQVSMVFDILFCIQHYVLYPSAAAAAATPTPLSQNEGDNNSNEQETDGFLGDNDGQAENNAPESESA